MQYPSDSGQNSLDELLTYTRAIEQADIYLDDSKKDVSEQPKSFIEKFAQFGQKVYNNTKKISGSKWFL